MVSVLIGHLCYRDHMNPCRAASAQEFPYKANRMVCYFEVINGAPSPVGTAIGDLRNAARRAVAGEATLYAVWPGQYRSDLFVIDQPTLLAEAIGA